MSVGTRVDLMFLACWLVAAGLAAIVIVAFLLFSSLPTIARGG
jgi:hypothetical protein